MRRALAELEAGIDGTEADMNFHKNQGFYNYHLYEGAVVLFLRDHTDLNNQLRRLDPGRAVKIRPGQTFSDWEGGSGFMEWDLNETFIAIREFSKPQPLLCLYTALKILEKWKKDLAAFFPHSRFRFLVNYQNDEGAICANMRFEKLRHGEPAWIDPAAIGEQGVPEDDEIGILVDEI